MVLCGPGQSKLRMPVNIPHVIAPAGSLPGTISPRTPSFLSAGMAAANCGSRVPNGASPSCSSKWCRWEWYRRRRRSFEIGDDLFDTHALILVMPNMVVRM